MTCAHACEHARAGDMTHMMDSFRCCTWTFAHCLYQLWFKAGLARLVGIRCFLSDDALVGSPARRRKSFCHPTKKQTDRLAGARLKSLWPVDPIPKVVLVQLHASCQANNIQRPVPGTRSGSIRKSLFKRLLAELEVGVANVGIGALAELAELVVVVAGSFCTELLELAVVVAGFFCTELPELAVAAAGFFCTDLTELAVRAAGFFCVPDWAAFTDAFAVVFSAKRAAGFVVSFCAEPAATLGDFLSDFFAALAATLWDFAAAFTVKSRG